MNIYVCKMKDRTYRSVEAVSWSDAKRYYGSRVVSIHAANANADQFTPAILGDQVVLQSLYETGGES